MIGRILLFLLAICIGSSCWAADDDLPYFGEPPTLPKRFALVVGVSRYSNSQSLQLRDLPDARADAVKMEGILKEIGFKDENVKTVIAPDAASVGPKKQAIVDALSDIVRDTGEYEKQSQRGAIVFLYFAGHGLSISGKNYIIPSDAYANSVEDLKNSSIELQTIVARFAPSKPELIIVVVDACRTAVPPNIVGAEANSVKPGLIEPSAGLTKPTTLGNHVYYVFSSKDGSASYGNEDIGGRFTHHFSSVLRDKYMNVRQAPDPTNKPSLRDVFEETQFNMMNSNYSKPQIPQLDDNLAYRFFLYPTKIHYDLEQAAWEALQAPSPANYDDARDARICALRRFLYEFSMYSYLSPLIFEEVKARPARLPPLDCEKIFAGLGRTDLAPTRGSNGKWLIPALTKPPATSTNPTTSSPSKRQGGLSRRIASQAYPDLIRRLKLSYTSSVGGSAGRGVVYHDYAQSNNAPLDPNLQPPSATGEGAVRIPTFGDLAAILQAQPLDISVGTLPNPEVRLDHAVIAKSKLFLRSLPGAYNEPVGIVPAGEFLEVLGTSPGRTWLQVRHTQFGDGYVSGDLVEPALVSLKNTTEFSTRQFTLDDKTKAELLTTFGLLGGVVIVDAVVEYPNDEGSLGLTRAASVRKFIEQTTEPRGSNPSRVYVSIRPVNPKTSGLGPHTVRTSILGLPLDRATRSALAAVASQSQGVTISLTPMPQDSNPSGAPGLVVCNSETGCVKDGRMTSPPGKNNEIRRETESIVNSIQDQENQSPITTVPQVPMKPGQSIDKGAAEAGKSIEKGAADVGRNVEKSVRDPARTVKDLMNLSPILKF